MLFTPHPPRGAQRAFETAPFHSVIIFRNELQISLIIFYFFSVSYPFLQKG